MILNLSDIKTEALLLLCRDIIEAYGKDSDIFSLDKEIIDKIKIVVDDISKQLNKVLRPNSYYTDNQQLSKVTFTLKAYNMLNNTLSTKFKNDQLFDPFMLCISMIHTWFIELQRENKNKKYIFFLLYTYTDIFDMIVSIKDKKYQKLSLEMMNIAESVAIDLENYNFK